MNLLSMLSMLFGKWELIHSGTAQVEYSSLLPMKDWTEQVFITVERHSRTKKERAFIHRLDGQKQPTSVGLVMAALAKVAP